MRAKDKAGTKRTWAYVRTHTHTEQPAVPICVCVCVRHIFVYLAGVMVMTVCCHQGQRSTCEGGGSVSAVDRRT